MSSILVHINRFFSNFKIMAKLSVMIAASKENVGPGLGINCLKRLLAVYKTVVHVLIEDTFYE